MAATRGDGPAAKDRKVAVRKAANAAHVSIIKAKVKAKAGTSRKPPDATVRKAKMPRPINLPGPPPPKPVKVDGPGMTAMVKRNPAKAERGRARIEDRRGAPLPRPWRRMRGKGGWPTLPKPRTR